MISLSDVGLLSSPVTNAIPASLTICLRDMIRKVIRELRGGRLPSVKPRAVAVERSKLPTSWKFRLRVVHHPNGTDKIQAIMAWT